MIASHPKKMALPRMPLTAGGRARSDPGMKRWHSGNAMKRASGQAGSAGSKAVTSSEMQGSAARRNRGHALSLCDLVVKTDLGKSPIVLWSPDSATDIWLLRYFPLAPRS